MSKRILYMTGIAALALFFLAPAIYSQIDMTHVIEDAYPKKERPPSLFDHDAHTYDFAEEYDLEELRECYYCHHFDGPDQDHMDDSVGISCSDCHPVDPDDPDVTHLTMAYHELCKGCHFEVAAGPIACGECHVR